MPSTANFGLRVPLSLLYDPDLRPAEKVLFGFLVAVPNHNPGYARISESLGFSRQRTSRALKALHASGWIKPRYAPRVVINGEPKGFSETTRYELRESGGRQFVLMVPRRRESVVQAVRGRSGTSGRGWSTATALLVAAYEQHRIERRLPRLSNIDTAELLGISHDSLARAGAVLDSCATQNGTTGGGFSGISENRRMELI
jgi:hypothetical protein